MALVRASSPTPTCTYQVFLSFRGEDTRKTFTDHLYTALVQSGIRTFRDDNEIERGKKIEAELQKAIQQSRISIVVFSKNYASSKWCLDELAMILKYRETSKHVVLPVFYDVDPSEVRKQTGRIGEAFVRHEEELKDHEVDEETKREWMNKIKGWRVALKEAADLTGMVLQNEANGHEARFITKIIEVVEDNLNCRSVLYVTRYLVGIHTRVKNINMWLQDRSANVNILVICGMGGIGKTTLATCVYNSNFREFESSSFLANVKDTSLLHLQRQILGDILTRKKAKICNVYEGSTKIKEAICSKRVLIVLDDVDQVNQLEALLVTREFYQGSKIIITTRDKGLLKAHEVHKVHTVEKLDDVESLELFSWHAFGQDHPFEGYIEQSKRVVRRCGGLPLAHEVLGSYFSGMSIDVWESVLKKLEAIPKAEIHKKLKISYDSLQDDHDKNLFLHIACFFVGEAKDDVVKILDECNFFTTVGIQSLIGRCLITIDEENRLMMHQLIQEMGREIVHEESPKDPGKRSRLWCHRDSFNVLTEKSGTKKIEGLILDMHMLKEDVQSSFNVCNGKKRRYKEYSDESLSNWGTSLKQRYRSFFSWQSVGTGLTSPNKVDLKIDAFETMGKLRLLKLNYVELSGCYKNFPENLRWLCWHGFPSKSIPIDLPLGKLVVLDMRYSKLEQLWEGIKVLGSLKILNLSHSQGLARTPNFLGLPNLEKLILTGCVSLVEVCESIGDLEGLILLDLKDCKNLKKFPNIGMLKFLETLIISGCSNLGEFPMELRNMESLKVLHVDGLAINPLPTVAVESTLWQTFPLQWVSIPRRSRECFWASLSHSLVSLSLEDCNLSNDSFPVNFSNLSSLQKLNLSKNPLRSLPDCIKGLRRLKNLYMRSCPELIWIQGLPNVEFLHVGESTSLEKIIGQSTSFPEFIIHTNCNRLKEVRGIYKFVPIEEVEIEILNNLGFFDAELLRNLEVRVESEFAFLLPRQSSNNVGSFCVQERHIQGLYEYGIFSTFLPRGAAPSWYSDENRGSSSISFTVPNHRIRGLNVCSVYALSDNEEIWLPRPLFTKINNKTKDLNWIYHPRFIGIPENDEELIWLSHWKFGNELEGGDEVDVSIIVGDGFKVKECGVKLVLGTSLEEEATHHNDSYLSWKRVIGGDLSPLQVSTGAYFLCHHAFRRRNHDEHKIDWVNPSWFEELFGDSEAAKEKFLAWLRSLRRKYNKYRNDGCSELALGINLVASLLYPIGQTMMN